jgi:DNA-binding NtrC family response regulator
LIMPARTRLTLTTLIVEDDEVSRAALVAAVGVIGASARTAATLMAAAAAVAEAIPDVVLLDLTLPDGDGTELLSQLEGTTCAVVVVTAHDDPHSAAEAFRKGAAAYLTKPVDVQRLWTVLSEIDDRRAT